MFRRFELVTAALILVTALATPASAHAAVTGSYATATTPGVSVVCSPNCLGVPGANIGGFQFPATGAGHNPVLVTIADASMGPVPFTVCQDSNANGVCGEVAAGEPRVVGCGTSAALPQIGATAFLGTRVTSVFVRIVDPVNMCAGGASSGTITLSYVT